MAAALAVAAAGGGGACVAALLAAAACSRRPRDEPPEPRSPRPRPVSARRAVSRRCPAPRCAARSARPRSARTRPGMAAPAAVAARRGAPAPAVACVGAGCERGRARPADLRLAGRRRVPGRRRGRLPGAWWPRCRRRRGGGRVTAGPPSAAAVDAAAAAAARRAGLVEAVQVVQLHDRDEVRAVVRVGRVDAGEVVGERVRDRPVRHRPLVVAAGRQQLGMVRDRLGDVVIDAELRVDRHPLAVVELRGRQPDAARRAGPP